jgi:hypothetical protein
MAALHAAASEERAEQCGLLDTVRERQRFRAFVELDEYVYPYANLTALSVVGGFNQWLYFLDDQYDDHPDTHGDLGHIKAIMQSSYACLSGQAPPLEDTPFLRFSRELARDIRALAPSGFFERFLPHVREYLFSGTLVELRGWIDRVTLSVDDYVELRCLDSGVYPVLDCIAIAAGVPIPEEVYDHPRVCQLARLCVLHVALANDLFSYEKEVLLSGSTMNLVRVLMERESRSLDDAVTHAVSLINGFARDFRRNEQLLPRVGPATEHALQVFVAGMKAWMSGHVAFSERSLRFRSIHSPFSELRSLGGASVQPDVLAGRTA